MHKHSNSNDPEGRLPLLVAWDLIVRHGGFLEGIEEEQYNDLLDTLSDHRNLAADLLSSLIHAIQHDPEQGGARFVKGAVDGVKDISPENEKASVYMSVFFGAVAGFSRPVGVQT